MNKAINYKKIKRDLYLRDTGNDARFTTKVVVSKKKYCRKKDKKVTDGDLFHF